MRKLPLIWPPHGDVERHTFVDVAHRDIEIDGGEVNSLETGVLDPFPANVAPASMKSPHALHPD